MFENEMYITITGMNYYYGMSPFMPGKLVSLHKEPDNPQDEDAISVNMPLLGTVGYVANSPKTTALGTMSAGRIHSDLPDECAAVVMFITQTKIIARVIPNKKLNVKIEFTLDDVNPIAFDPLTIEAIKTPNPSGALQ